jgi:hypothetical protein
MKSFLLILICTLTHAASPAFVTVAEYGDPADQKVRDQAARDAFKRKIPLWLDSGTAVLDINPTAEATEDTPEARHRFFAQVCAWQGTCRTANDARVVIRIAKGLHTVSAWDALGIRAPNIRRKDPQSPVLELVGDHVIEIIIAALEVGERAKSDFTKQPPILRYRYDYPLNVTLEKPLPTHVVPGFAIGMKNISGSGNAEALSGAVKVESIATDRLSFTTTVTSLRGEAFKSPGKLDTTTPFQGLMPSRIVIPSACLGIDTSYKVEAAQNISSVVRGESTRVTMTAPHGLSAGQMVRLSEVKGMSELNGQQLIVAAPVTATEFFLHTLNHAPLDSRSYGEWSSGGELTPVRELWTGGDYEGYLEFYNGARGETKFLGLSYIGHTGIAFAQEVVMVADSGTRFQANAGTVLTGAGSRIMRGAFLATLDMNQAYCGGGGCQYAIGIQGGCHGTVIRSMVGGARGYTISVADDSHMNVAASVVAGGSAAVILHNRSFVSFQAAKASGNATGLLATGGSGFQIDSSTLIHANTTGISRNSGAPGAGSFYGKPTFGKDSLANTQDANFTDGPLIVKTDTNLLLSHPESPTHIRHTATLTADRLVTLSKRGALPGTTFVITRSSGGDFALKVGAPLLKALKPNSWCEVTFDGDEWYLSRYGEL